MKIIWIIGQAGPIEGENWRDYRNNQFGKYLSTVCGYQVIWWTSNFSHHFKKFRSDGWKDIEVNDNYIIRLVPSTGYKKNFSVGRFRCIASFARNCGERFETETVPDLIIGNCVMTKGYPIFPYAQKHSIPIIVDQGDIWPEFIEKSMGKLSKLGRVLFTPLYAARRKNYANAHGYIALGKNYLEFARTVAPNGCEKPSELVYNGIDLTQFDEMAKAPLNPDLVTVIDKRAGEYLCVFAGTFGPSYDIDAMLSCGKLFEKEKLPIKIILAGSGPREEDIKKAASECKNIVFVGTLKPSELIPLYVVCDIGICAYTAKSNVDMPDKFYDYTAAGLAVVNSLTEEVAEYISSKKIGFNYTASSVMELHQAIIDIVHGDIASMKSNSRQLSRIFDSSVQNAKLGRLAAFLMKDEG